MFESLKYIMEIQDKARDIINETKYDIHMTREDNAVHYKADRCYLCFQKFHKNNPKVRDHDHLKPKFNYRGPACNNCNLRCNKEKYFSLPVIAHNLKGYDSHFIFQYAGLLKRDISVIPLTDEKYLSFTIDECVFLDSYQFTLCSLDKLVDGMNKTNNK
jgi:hypothetical protein